MAHTVENKRALLTRIRRIRGQSEALERALDQDADCGAVLQQIAAIRGAVNGLMAKVLEGHVREHLGSDVTDHRQRQEDVQVVLAALRAYMK